MESAVYVDIVFFLTHDSDPAQGHFVKTAFEYSFLNFHIWFFFNRKKAVRRKAKTRDLTIEVDEREPTTLVIRGRQVTIYFWFFITLLIAISYILCWPGWTRVSQVQATHRLGGSSTNTGISSHNHNQTTNRNHATQRFTAKMNP